MLPANLFAARAVEVQENPRLALGELYNLFCAKLILYLTFFVSSAKCVLRGFLTSGRASGGLARSNASTLTGDQDE